MLLRTSTCVASAGCLLFWLQFQPAESDASFGAADAAAIDLNSLTISTTPDPCDPANTEDEDTDYGYYDDGGYYDGYYDDTPVDPCAVVRRRRHASGASSNPGPSRIISPNSWPNEETLEPHAFSAVVVGPDGRLQWAGPTVGRSNVLSASGTGIVNPDGTIVQAGGAEDGPLPLSSLPPLDETTPDGGLPIAITQLITMADIMRAYAIVPENFPFDIDLSGIDWIVTPSEWPTFFDMILLPFVQSESPPDQDAVNNYENAVRPPGPDAGP